MKEVRILTVSGKAQRGKDTSAGFMYEELTKRGYKVLLTHYADLLKWMCSNYFGWNGQKDEAGRTILQKVGTDVIRAQDPDFWVRWIVNLLKLFPNEWDYVIIPDCRFPNEIEILKENFDSVTHVRVVRPDFISPLTEEQQKHISETALDEYSYDVLLKNTSLDELKAQIKDLCTSQTLETSEEEPNDCGSN